MIYFLTDWQSENPSLESNVVFNVNKVFHEGKIETKIINTQVSPFLNYLTNSFEFYDSDHFIQLFDSVTDRFALNYAPLTMNDLEFPTNWEKVYTRTNVLLSENGKIKAKVFLNSFGFISQVDYYTSLGKEVHVFSEKGTIISKKMFDPLGKQIEQQYFDEGERLILTQWSDYVFISEFYQSRFKRTTYQSFSEVCKELINVALEQFDPKKDRLVIDGTSEWLMTLGEGFKFPESIVYLFTGSTQNYISQAELHLNLMRKGIQVITDNGLLQDELKKSRDYYEMQNAPLLIPFYPTTLTLGESNTYSEQYIYWQIEQFEGQIANLFNKFLEMKLMTPELCLIIESEVESDEKKVDTLLIDFMTHKFEVNINTSEYQLVKEYYEAVENEELTPGLRELFQVTKLTNPEFSRVIDAYLFYAGITFKRNSNIQALQEEFQKVRIYIDQRVAYEFLSHSIAVSAGIPVLSRMPSPYLADGKNGLIFNEEKQLLEAVKHYLSEPDQWNQSLVESVEMIEVNSSASILEKWKKGLE